MPLDPTLRGQGSSMLGPLWAQGSHLPLAPRSESILATAQNRNRPLCGGLLAGLKDFRRILGITKLGALVMALKA